MTQEKKKMPTLAVAGLLVGILIIGTFLRFYKITNKEIWYDEAFSAKIVTNSYDEVFLLSKADVHPPLYYFVLKTWVAVFGNSEVSLRAPSIIFGILTIPLAFYLVFFMTSDKKKALWTSLIVAVNPFLVTYSKEARSYSMLAFITVLATLLVIKGVRDKKYLGISILLPILFLTHYIAIFGIAVLVIFLLSKDRKFAVYLLPLLFVVALWIPVIMGNKNTEGTKWIPKFSLVRIPQSIHAFVLGVDNNEMGVASPINPLPINSNTLSMMISICIVFLILKSEIPSKNGGLLLLFGIVPITLVALTSLYLGKHMYVERYLIGYAILLIIYGATALPKPFILIPYAVLSIYLTLSFKTVNAGYREIKGYKTDRPIVMVDATEYITAKYYLKTIKLQEGDWSGWGIITNEDIFDKNKAKESFYLVNRGGLKGWEPKFSVGKFKFFDWTVI